MLFDSSYVSVNVKQRAEAVGPELQFQTLRQALQLTTAVLGARRAIRRVGGDEEFGRRAAQAQHGGSCRPNCHSLIDLLRAGRNWVWPSIDFNETKSAGRWGNFHIPQHT